MSARNNFDELRYEYFRDTTVALEAFKADQIDWRTENSAKDWATAYDFPAVQATNASLLEEFPIPQLRRHAGLRVQYPPRQVQGSARAPRLQLRVRFRGDEQADVLRPVQAHRQLFRGHRACVLGGLPQGLELEILKTVKRQGSARGFHHRPTPIRSTATPEAVRNNLREALRLLQGGRLRRSSDQKLDQRRKPASSLTVEFLLSHADLRAHRRCSTSRRWSGSASTSPSARSTTANTRTGCAAGTTTSSSRAGAESLSPGNEQRDFWGSQAADQPGSRNYVGIKNPAIDALIDRVDLRQGPRRAVAATKALDRVLLWNYYVVPQWTYGKVRTARWDRFGRPETHAEIRRVRPSRSSGGGTPKGARRAGDARRDRSQAAAAFWPLLARRRPVRVSGASAPASRPRERDAKATASRPSAI